MQHEEGLLLETSPHVNYLKSGSLLLADPKGELLVINEILIFNLLSWTSACRAMVLKLQAALE